MAIFRIAAPYLDKKWHVIKCASEKEAYSRACDAHRNGCFAEAWQTQGDVSVKTWPPKTQ